VKEAVFGWFIFIQNWFALIELMILLALGRPITTQQILITLVSSNRRNSNGDIVKLDRFP